MIHESNDLVPRNVRGQLLACDLMYLRYFNYVSHFEFTEFSQREAKYTIMCLSYH